MFNLSTLISSYDNFIFDLYGTLIDIRTDEWADETWVNFCEYLDGRGIKHPNIADFRNDFFALDRKKRIENTQYEHPEIEILDVYTELFLSYGNTLPEDLPAISYRFRECSREYMRLFPKLLQFFDILKANSKKIYILSNAQASYTRPEIEYFGLDKIMDDFIMSSDFGCMKPEKHFYDILLDRHKMNRARTVMFGDSIPNDVNGAIGAGINAVHVTGTDFYENLVADYPAQEKTC